jgi:hypothetical protein
MSAAANATAEGFSDRIRRFLAEIEVRPAITETEREAIFRLRHQAYLAEGAITPRPGGVLHDSFDEDPNAWIFGLYVRGFLASSIRIHVATPRHPRSPGAWAFREEVMPAVEAGATVIDPSRLVADRFLARRHSELPYATVRLGFVACEHFGADIGLATVRSEHQAFYERLFGLRLICEPRKYPGLIKPLGLMAIDYPSVRERCLERHPFLQSSEDERRALFGSGELPSTVRPPLHERAVAPPSDARAHLRRLGETRPSRLSALLGEARIKPTGGNDR